MPQQGPFQNERHPPYLRLSRRKFLESWQNQGNQGESAAHLNAYELRNNQKNRHCQRSGGASVAVCQRLHPPLQGLLQFRNVGFRLRTAFFAGGCRRNFAACLPDYISGLSLLGGEPFERPNQSELAGLLEEFKRRFPSKTVWCYTGYLFDRDILENMAVKWDEPMRMLSNIDVLVDGEFVEEKKDLKLRFRGSSNQRIIDVKKSLATGQVVLAEEFYEKEKK